MNIIEFKTIIKECVREELINMFGTEPGTVSTKFTSAPTNVMTQKQKLQKPSTQPQTLSSMLNEIDDSSDDTVPVQKEFKKYTKNEILNKILNETKALPPEGSMVSGVSQIMEDSTGTRIVTKSDAMLESVDDVKAVAVLKTAFTKDYSKLLRAVDKKVNGGSIRGLVTIDESIDATEL